MATPILGSRLDGFDGGVNLAAGLSDGGIGQGWLVSHGFISPQQDRQQVLRLRGQSRASRTPKGFAWEQVWVPVHWRCESMVRPGFAGERGLTRRWSMKLPRNG